MEPFLGEIRLFAGTYAPQGWNFCDGTVLQISQNDALYSLIGTSYGGDGQTTFALPDLRGRVPIHQGSVPNVGTYNLGDTGGAETVTLTVGQMPQHSHQLVATTAAGTTTNPNGNVIAQAMGSCKLFAPAPADTAYNSAHVTSVGSGGAHENRQPYVAINYIIALGGIWPSQG